MCTAVKFITCQNSHKLDVIWNNIFRIFKCCWPDSVKPLQYLCIILPSTYSVDQRQILFSSKMTGSNNVLFQTLRKLTVKEQLSVCTKYDLNNVCAGNAEIKHPIWCNFAQSTDM
jgi:hypothetical protein